jgi:prepilin-type N-terminal cleavage/methylation domain-containing protein
MRRRKSDNRPAFTLVELLVCIALIGVLAALLLVAIDKAWGAAAGANCRSNLRQLGIALHNFHDTCQTLPVYFGIYRTAGPVDPDAEPSWVFGGWYAHLLPCTEQDNVYNAAAEDARAAGWNRPRREPGPGHTHVWVDHGIYIAKVRHAPLPLMRCPSDPTADAKGTVGNGHWAGTNYLANFHVFTLSHHGLFAPPVRFGQITDGLSCTLLLGEGYQRCHNPHGHTERIALLSDSEHFGVHPGTWAPDTYPFQDQPHTDACDPNRAQGIHAGGMSACFGDGAVRQVSAAVSPSAWQALLLPNDGAVVDPGDW